MKIPEAQIKAAAVALLRAEPNKFRICAGTQDGIYPCIPEGCSCTRNLHDLARTVLSAARNRRILPSK